MRKTKLNEAQQRWVRDWWQALQPRVEGDAALPGILWAMGRGERARLRRCWTKRVMRKSPCWMQVLRWQLVPERSGSNHKPIET